MRLAIPFWVAAMLAPIGCNAQSAATMAALQGLSPISVLPNSPAGKQALAANLTVTGGIQTGALKQPTLLPFADQQQQALRDAFITGWNASELADGLGTKLGAVYQSKAKYSGPKDYTSISPAVATLIAYTNETTAVDSNAAKFFFANGTTDGKKPVSAEVATILKRIDGKTDVFGIAYGRVAGSSGADAYGDSRPFQTEPVVKPISGSDYFGSASTNLAYLRGPAQDLSNNPSFPSGHTTYGYAQSLVLAILVPERYPQEIARAAEYGNDRIILGAHYAMDVIGGRTLALYDVAHLLANDPFYVGQPKTRSPEIADYRQAVTSARGELTAVLEAGCGGKIAACAAQDAGRFRDAAADEAFYDATQTYGLPVVYPATAGAVEKIAKVAPEAGYLLTVAFPYLSLDEADTILTETEGPGGGFLDDGSAFGVYSRLDLFAAGKKAIARARSR
jgi:hypothetical protein